MSAARRLLAGLGLLVVTSTAAAEPSWTVWIHLSGDVDGVPVPAGDTWERSRSTPTTQPECVALRDRMTDLMYAYLRGLYKDIGSVTLEGEATIIFLWTDARGQHRTTTSFECWPDTADRVGRRGIDDDG
jgi:hypothetical protein